MKDIKNAPLFKRIVASILDGAFFALLFLLSFSFIMTPIANNAMGLTDNVLLGYQYESASHLYVLCQVISVETGEDTIIEVKDYTERIKSGSESAIRSINTREEVDSTYLLNHLKYYYLNYKTGENIELPNDTISKKYDKVADHFVDPDFEKANEEGKLPKDIYTEDWFNTEILTLGKEEAIYELNASNEYVLTASFKASNTNPSLTEEENNKNIEKAARKYMEEKVYYGQKDLFYTRIIQEINHNVSVAQNLMIIVPSVVCLLLVYLLFPLIFENGETLGKKTMSLCLINKLDYKVSKPQVLLRQLILISITLFSAFIIGIGFTSLVTLGVAVFLMLIVVLFVPNNRALHDLAAGTRVIDAKSSVFFANAEMEAKAVQELNEKMEKYRANKPENKNVIQVGAKIVDEKVRQEIEEEQASEKKE